MVVVAITVFDMMEPYRQRYLDSKDSDSDITPQSQETPVAPLTTTQNATFHSYSPGSVVEVDSEMDSLRSEGVTNDLDLNKFFERPVLIRMYEWQVGASPGSLFTLNPWDVFFTNKRVINRISNFKLLRAKLHVRVLINGTPFHYGRILMSYTPIPGQDDVGRRLFSNLVQNSQKPHMWINPTTSQGGDIVLPFLWHQNACNIPTSDFSLLGELDFYGVTPLVHANGGSGTTADVQLSVYAWATDVVLSCPTHVNPISIVPQSDEYGNKVFSVRASNLANMASKLSSAPYIGPYARATSIAASAASAVASLFGYSKPLDLERTIMVPKVTSPFAVCNGNDDTNKVSVDAKQEVTIDPRAFGLGSKDEMQISHVVQTESYLTQFSWDPGNSSPAGSILWNCVVDPMLYTTAGSGTSPELIQKNLTALAFGSLPFQYWRGSIKFRFQVVCSAMHRGRLRIVYDPEMEATFYDPTALSPEMNLGYNTIVDISETTDFEITVGWTQSTSYREHAPLDNPDSLMHSTTALPYDASNDTYGNGVLGVYIVNELVSPSASTASVTILVSVSAGEDFEVAAPTSKWISSLRYRTFSDVPVPQSAEQPVASVTGGQTNLAEGAEHIDTLAQTVDLHGPANMVHFGESVRSFRTLLKRYNLAEVACMLPNTNPGAQTFRHIIIQRAAMPSEPGFTSRADGTSTVPIIVATKYYRFGQLTLLRYITSGFVGWRGGIRWKVVLPNSCCNTLTGPGTLSRYSSCTPSNFTLDSPALSTATFQRDYVTTFDESSYGHDGSAIFIPSVEPVGSIEVPYYTAKRFSFGRRLAGFSAQYVPQDDPCWKFAGTSINVGDTALRGFQTWLYCAAAEDFSLGMFLGAPVVFLEGIPPT